MAYPTSDFQIAASQAVANFRGRGFAAIPEVFYDRGRMADCSSITPSREIIQAGTVVRNQKLCRDHFRLTMRVASFADAAPGQFVHLCPESQEGRGYVELDDPWATHHEPWWADLQNPMLRRAFSVSELVRTRGGVELDVMYRVVGTATRWLAKLESGDSLSIMGPLGKPFPISKTKSQAWLVAGGVGLPPLLWLAKALNGAGKEAIAFCGSQTRDLLALEVDEATLPAADASAARLSSTEFARVRTPVVISTDDGTLGFKGHIGAALTAYANANPPDARDLVIYTCGPERMMHFVAEFCRSRDIECYVCVERNMACGTGMCQSCIVPVADATDAAGWRYRLCCTEGPVFEGRSVLWDR